MTFDLEGILVFVMNAEKAFFLKAISLEVKIDFSLAFQIKFPWETLFLTCLRSGFLNEIIIFCVKV